MWLTSSQPLFHAPARENRIDVIPRFIFLECCRCRDVTLASAYFMNFLESHMRIIKLESIREAQRLINYLVAINEGLRRNGFGTERITHKGSDPALCKGEHQCVHPVGFCGQQVHAPASAAARGATMRDMIVCHHLGARQAHQDT